MKFKMSLKQTWTALILFTGIMPVIIVSIWSGQQIYQNELDSALTIERHTNEMLRSQIESELKRYKTLLKNKSDPLSSLVAHPHTPDALMDMNALLRLIPEREDAIHEIIIISTQQLC